VTELRDSWVVHGTAGPDFMEALDRAVEEGARFLVDQWGFTIEEAFIFLSVACDANICQACRPQEFSTNRTRFHSQSVSHPPPLLMR